MRTIDCPQGSPEWIKARLGRVTCSNLSKIITTTGRASTSDTGYLAQLVCEWLLDAPVVDSASSAFMERGTAMEDKAVGAYAFDTGTEPEKVGLCIRDDGLLAGSPDRLVGEDGILEIKVPEITTHMDYLLGGLESAYFAQCQGLMSVTGRKWVDLYSFNPILPAAKLRIEPDAEWVEKMDTYLVRFEERFEAAKKTYGTFKERRAELVAAMKEREENRHPF